MAGGRSSTRTRCHSSRSPPRARCASCLADRRSGTAHSSGAGVICMPPMYINIGSYVGDGTLVDSHALIGSCAQIGARVHVSAAAQIGGVLEPVGALPVIVEDDVLIGGNCGVYEGAVIKRRAVLASGTILTGSTPIYDLPNERIIEPAVRPAADRSGRSGGGAGHPADHQGHRPRVAPLGGDADHRQVSGRARPTPGRRSKHGSARDHRVRPGTDRHRLDDRPRARGGRLAGRRPAPAWLHRRASSRWRAAARTFWRRWTSPRSCCRLTSIACRHSFPPRCATAASSGAAHATRKESWRRSSPRRSACGPAASGASACCS